MPPLTLTSTISLSTNPPTAIPRLGFGVYESHGSTCKTSCLAALRAGYRHVDSAQYYANEDQVQAATASSSLPRESLFLTTKMLFPGPDAEATYAGIAESVRKLGGDVEGAYVDLFLIHTPNGGPAGVKLMWQALERAHAEGLCRAIGVSNFRKEHIEAMKEYARVWPPHVNQIELHPWCQQRACVTYCASANIVISAYCPLVRNQKAADPTLNAVAARCGKSTAQVLVRYALQKGWVPLPKSDNPGRIQQNADVFGWEIGGEDMEALDGLDEGAAGAIVQAVVD